MIGTDDVLEARNSASGRTLVEPLEQLALGLLVLDDRLDRRVGALEVLDDRREREPLARPPRASLRRELAGAHGRGPATSRSRRARAPPRPASASTTVTSTPERAHTSAMPEPIRPPPTTPIRMAATLAGGARGS